jgi:hypothetical protein
MALSILDGNQSATTLSTILSSGQHITAHTVVSLGTQAITDMRGAVSGSVVSISNLPSTQTIAGTVTANLSAIYAGEAPFSQADNPMIAVGGLLSGFNEIRPITIDLNSGGQIVAGTVTANLGDGLVSSNLNAVDQTKCAAVQIFDEDGNIKGGSSGLGVNPIGLGDALADYALNQGVTNPLPISGTVTIGSAIPAGTNQIGSVTASISGTVPISISSVTVGNSVTIASLPAISGTVTANSSNGSLTTRFGSVTTANTAFATSAVTNANRKYLLIQNVTTASNVITVGIGFTPTTTQGIQLSSGAGLTFEGSYIPTGAVNLLSSVTASCFTILEA